MVRLTQEWQVWMAAQLNWVVQYRSHGLTAGRHVDSKQRATIAEPAAAEHLCAGGAVVSDDGRWGPDVSERAIHEPLLLVEMQRPGKKTRAKLSSALDDIASSYGRKGAQRAATGSARGYEMRQTPGAGKLPNFHPESCPAADIVAGVRDSAFSEIGGYSAPRPFACAHEIANRRNSLIVDGALSHGISWL
jgi:hypothetical protein